MKLLMLQDTTTTSAKGMVLADTVQEELCASAARLLRAAGYVVSVGVFGDIADVRVDLRDGKRLRLVPMVETVWGDLDEPDVDLWHVGALDAAGVAIEYGVDHPDYGMVDPCPSVLWAARAGIDPAVAIALLRDCFADEDLCLNFGLSR